MKAAARQRPAAAEVEVGAARWRRVETLFADASARPPAARGPFLDAACAGDPGLRAEVEALLAADGVADALLGELVAAGARAVVAAQEETVIGRRVGPYEVVSEIGRGGMSTVYLAERSDEEFDRRVALKLMRHCMDSRDLVARFRAERRILARLDHPYIARLIDGGTWEDGRPYFLLEHVEGERIDRFCDRRSLSVADRLRLFVKVCEAVHSAHRHLVVHRDLKPSNVLVTADGSPKLLDFGIAKLLAPGGSGETAVTGPAARPMTLAYASPEQVRGAPVTTASDVYSLGVVLYELLVGRLPHPGDEMATADRERAICELEPERPSLAVRRTAGRADARARRLAGDLDNVVAKALHKEPERRYGSVEQLAEDLTRHLAGHPVIARPDTVAYRLGKFVRRHRLGTAAAAAALAAILAVSGGLAVQSWRLVRERDHAQRIEALVVDLFQVADPDRARGATVTARELLDRGAERVAAFDGQPETRAMLLAKLAELYGALGLYEQAAALLEQTLVLDRRLHPGDHPDTVVHLNHLGKVLAEQGDFRAAEPRFAAALAMADRLFGTDSPEGLATLNNLALVRHDLGDYAGAEPLYQRALEIVRRDGGRPPAYLLDNLSLLLFDRGDYAGAEAIVRALLADGGEGDDRSLRADHLERLGQIRQARGDHAAAEIHLAESLALRRAEHGEEHRDVARGLTALGALRRERGDLAAAAPLLAAGLEQRRRLLGETHAEFAESLRETAALLAAEGRAAEAEAHYRRALAIYRRSLSPDHPLTGLTAAGLAAVLAAGGDCAAAAPLLREALARVPAADWRRPPAAAALAHCGEGGPPAG